MDEETKEMLRTLLVVEVLSLSKLVETERRAKGVVMADFLGDALREVAQKRPEILRRLAETR